MSGASIEQLEGYTTALVSSTGISGDEAGVALKGIVSRTFRIGAEGEDDAGKSEEKLKGLGIAVRGLNGDFRSINDILVDINSKWSSWNNITQISLAQTMAGTLHYSKFVNLMENFSIATNATATALNSQGSAFRENEKYMNSISGKLAILGTTVQEKWTIIFNSPQFVKVIEALTIIIDKFITLNGVLTTMGAIFLLVVRVRMAGFITDCVSLVAGLVKVKVATEALTMVLSKVTLAIGLIVIAFSVVSSIINANRQSVENLAKANAELSAKFEAQRSNLDGVSGFYEKNSELSKTNTEIKEQLVAMQEKLIDTYGKEADGLDLVNGKQKDNIEILKKLKGVTTEHELKANLASREEILNQKYASPILTSKGISGIVGTTDYNVNSKVDNPQDNKFGVPELNARKTMGIVEYYASIKKAISDIEENIQSTVLQENGLINPSNIAEKQNAIKALVGELELLEPLMKTLANTSELEKQAFAEAFTGALTPVKQLRGGVVAITDDFQKFSKTQNTIFEGLTASKGDTESFSEYQTRHEGVGTALIKLKADGSNMAQVIADVKAVTGQDGAVVDTAFAEIFPKIVIEPAQIKTFTELAKEVKASVMSIKELNDIQGDMAKGGKLSADSMIDLITQFPQLIDYITLTTDGYVVEAGGIEIVRNALIKEQETALWTGLKITEDMKVQLAARLGMTMTEIQSIKTLSEARAIGAKTLFNTGGQRSNIPQEVIDGINAQANSDTAMLVTIAEMNVLIQGLHSGLKIPTAPKAPKAKATPSALDSKDFSDEAIRAFNVSVQHDKLAIKSLETQIKTAEKAKDYNTQLKLTNDLLILQRKTLVDLDTARDNMAKKANEVRLKADMNSLTKGLDTTKWFDAEGNATVAYGKDYNKDAGKTDETSKKRRIAIEALFDSLQKLKQGWQANSDEIITMGDNIDTTVEKINQINLDKMQASQTLQQTMMDLRRKQYQADLDAEQEAHDDILEKLDDEMTAYEDMIDDKITALDRLHSAENYDADIGKKNKKIMETQSQIDALAMDNSAESVARRTELLKTLTDLNDEKDQTVRKHAEDSEKESLEQLLTDKQDNIDEQIKLEDDKFTVIDDKFQALMKDEKLLADTTMELLELSATELIAIYGTLFTRFEAGATSAGNALKAISIDQAITGVVETRDEDLKQVVGLRDFLVSKGIQNSDITSQNINGIIQVSVKGVPINTEGYSYANGKFSASIERILRSISMAGIAFKTGGYTGNSEGMAYLDKKEIILNAMDTTNFLKAIDMTRMISDKVGKMGQAFNVSEKKTSHVEAIFNLAVTAPDGADTMEIAKTVEKFIWDNMSRKLSEEGIG